MEGRRGIKLLKFLYVIHKQPLRTKQFFVAGIRHNTITCKSCGNNAKNAVSSSGIFGIRWNCSNCSDVDLCTPCYMSEKHDTSHIFWRIDRTAEASGTNGATISSPWILSSRKLCPLKKKILSPQQHWTLLALYYHVLLLLLT